MAEDGERELPKLGDHAISGQLGEALVEVAMLELGQLYERCTGLDFGVDGVIELTAGEGAQRASGRQIGVQVKRGLSVVRATKFGRTLYCSRQHANYWRGHSLPIIVVHCEPETKRLRWTQVDDSTLRETSEGFAIDLPENSDLLDALPALQTLADRPHSPTTAHSETLLIPYSFEKGILVSDLELGLAALAFTRAALRGEKCQLAIEIADEPDLVARIDQVRDIISPAPELSRDAIIRKDILHRYRKQASGYARALTLLLTEPSLADMFGYQDDLLAAAIRRTCKAPASTRTAGDIHLQAWPGPMRRPIVSFDVPPDALDYFYGMDSINRQLIRMGDAGGVTISALPHDVIANCFLPALAHSLLRYADANDLADRQALKETEEFPTNWSTGIA